MFGNTPVFDYGENAALQRGSFRISQLSVRRSIYQTIIDVFINGQSTRPQYLSKSTNSTGQNLLRYK